MKRIGVVGIVVKGDRSLALEMQKVLSDFGDIIVGRMGVPRDNVSTIALIVEGSQERISALTGRLGQFDGLAVKSALTSFEVQE
ncbi:MAG: CopG family transcriptional regulator [Clostridia bacterium]|nr:CopG family transcriptional regulator [Clostridia bacterium]